MREAWQRPTGAAVGRVAAYSDAADTYVGHLLSVVPHRLDGLKVVVDCANGAASVVSPRALREAGAQVVVIHAEPDGLNINEACGSTHLEDLCAAVVAHGADAGIAHDGDADRCLAVAADGTDINGDVILALLATSLREHGSTRAVVPRMMPFDELNETLGKDDWDVIP